MRTKNWLPIAFGGLAVIFGTIVANGRAPDDVPAATPRTDDRAAIVKAGQEFVQAYEKQDAKAIASMWTESGEYLQGDELIVGRAAIEKAFADHFKAARKSKIAVYPLSIRFPSRDVAIEEGTLVNTGTGKELPTSSMYSSTLVREGGQWKIAISREWGGDQDRIVDLDWLIGTWRAGDKADDMTLTYTKLKDKPIIHGTFSTKADSKVVNAGHFRIAFDPQRGQLRSWHFDDLGGHGQGLWLRDGDRWVMDSLGVLPDGTETHSVSILHRNNPNEIVWQSIDRVAGGLPLPDTKPIKLTRAPE